MSGMKKAWPLPKLNVATAVISGVSAPLARAQWCLHRFCSTRCGQWTFAKLSTRCTALPLLSHCLPGGHVRRESCICLLHVTHPSLDLTKLQKDGMDSLARSCLLENRCANKGFFLRADGIAEYWPAHLLASQAFFAVLCKGCFRARPDLHGASRS